MVGANPDQGPTGGPPIRPSHSISCNKFIFPASSDKTVTAPECTGEGPGANADGEVPEAADEFDGVHEEFAQKAKRIYKHTHIHLSIQHYTDIYIFIYT